MPAAMKLLPALAALLVSSAWCYPFHEDFSNELHSVIRAKAKELMKRDMADDVTTHTYTLDRQLHKDLLRELIQEELTKDNLKTVVKFVSRQHEDFLFPGYVKIYEEIHNKSLGDYALFHLAYQVQQDRYKGQVLPLLAMFPLAVWSVLTSKTVCIKNRGYGEYLYAAANDMNFDALRRNVFTWTPHNEAGLQGDWKFEHLEGNRFHIVNSRFPERLYAEADALNFDAERRRVFTATPKFSGGDVWAMELDGEDVFLKNVLYNEYMYALDGSQYDEKRRRVLTWIPKGRDNCDSYTYQCRWFVSLC